jgi:hypothetical protein
MSSGKMDWDKVRTTVRAEVEAQVSAALKQQSSEGNTIRWMKDWQLPAIVVGCVAVVLGILLTQSYDRNGKQEHFQGEVGATLTRVKENIQGLQNDVSSIKDEVATLKLQIALSQPIAQFKSHLSELRPSLALVQQQRSKIPPAIMSDLQSKLRTVGTDAPSYWPVVADFVSYRSVSAASWAIKTLPNCRDTKPSATTLNFNTRDTAKLAANMLGYHDCRLAIDSTLDGAWLNPLIFDNKVIFFKRCVVVYNGGSIEIKLDLAKNRVVDAVRQGVHAMTLSVDNALTFDDCIFEVSVEQSPSDQAKQLTAFLLAQNTGTIALPIRKAG